MTEGQRPPALEMRGVTKRYPGVLANDHIDRAAAATAIRELGHQFGFEIDPGARVGSLSVGWQQRVEILKALYRKTRILILDEPTAVLTPQETREIFAVRRRLADAGTTVIF